ncbi:MULTISPECIES: HipA domain-containing protein [unclassified Luteococcus]|uniref:HipA domain-containing protein n=1 Tax=unclassified Luteococcus TaxID=2639923 RepID=UPI00313BB426
MAKDLAIFLGEQRAGTIHQGPGLEFRYADEYLASEEATPLSLSMPLSERPYTNRIVTSWLVGLLPADRTVRLRIAQRGGVNPRNPVALLSVVGLDCPGAVRACWADEVDRIQGQTAELVPVDDGWIAERLARFVHDEASWQIADERWSIGGGQSKFTLTRTAAGWADPRGSAASTHIVKPGVSGVKHQALNEHLCLRILAAAGLPVAASQYLEFEGRGAIVERRFDRLGAGGEVRRLHAEDMCQALGNLYPYERDGGPHAKDVVEALATRADEASRDRFVDALVATYLLGAPDGHARNYSVLLSGGAAQLAPLYDIASSLPYDVDGEGIMHQRKAAMSIGGERQFGMVRQAQWRRFFEINSLGVDRGLARVEDLAARLPQAVEQVKAQQDGIPGTRELLARVLPAVERMCALTVS